MKPEGESCHAMMSLLARARYGMRFSSGYGSGVREHQGYGRDENCAVNYRSP